MADADLNDVLAAAAPVIAAAPGLLTCHWPMPETIAEFPVAMLEPIDGTVTMGQHERWADRFDCDVFVERDNLPARLPVILPLLEQIVIKVRQNIQLGGIVSSFAVIGYRFTQLSFNGQPYVGLRINLLTHRTRHVSVSDG